MTLPAGIQFRPLTVPESMDAPDAAEFREYTRVRNAVYREISGRDDESITPEELLPHFLPDPSERRFAWVVVDGDDIVGRIGVDLPLEEGSHVAFWLIELLESVHGRGIGTAAYALVEQTARDHGRTVLQSWAEHPDAPGPRIEAPTGFGSIPEDRIARFYLRNGYTLEQIERESALDLEASAPEVARLLEVASTAASGYRVVQWQAPTPPPYLDAYAWMKSRMSTDTPMGALEFDEESWDAARVEREDRKVLAGARRMLVTAAQHVASGALVAFNELVIGPDPTGPSFQHDTLVLREHRGHRLGLLVKCAGLTTWRAEIASRSPRVITDNAEENRPMLDINEAIGFVPVAYNGAWKKVLT
ncbi:N-acetyltransferase family protein [Microbacterium lacticum]